MADQMVRGAGAKLGQPVEKPMARIQTQGAQGRPTKGGGEVSAQSLGLQGGGLGSERLPSRDSGEPLSNAQRAFFEPRFGHDFSRVRIHRGASAARAAKTLQARAFTYGNQVFFGAGEYSPDTRAGKRLLAHELTHVVQQQARSGWIQRQEDPQSQAVPPSSQGSQGPQGGNVLKIAFLGAAQTRGGWVNQVSARTSNVFSSSNLGKGPAAAWAVIQNHFANSQGPQDVRMVGYSWGGWSALKLAGPLLREYGPSSRNPRLSKLTLGTLDPVSTMRHSLPGGLSNPVTTHENIYQTNGCYGQSRCIGLSSWYQGQAIPGANNKDVTLDGRGKGTVSGVPASSTPDHVHLGYQGYGGYDQAIAKLLG